MFIKKTKLLLILLATTICSYTYASYSTFNNDLADKIAAIGSIDDVADTINWVTERINNDTRLITYGAGVRRPFSYGRNFRQPINEKIQALKSTGNLSDDDIAERLAPKLTALIEAFKATPQTDVLYAEHYKNNLTHLEALKNEISPSSSQSNDKLIAAIRKALAEVNTVLERVTFLEQQKIQATAKQGKLSLTSEQELSRKYKELEEAINELKFIREQYSRDIEIDEADMADTIFAHQETLKELEVLTNQIRRKKAQHEIALARIRLNGN